MFRYIVLCFDDIVLCFNNTVLCFDNIVMCFDNTVLCFDNSLLCSDNTMLCLKKCLLCLQIWATVHVSRENLNCKTVAFFLKISKEIAKAWRKSLTRAKGASLTRQ